MKVKPLYLLGLVLMMIIGMEGCSTKKNKWNRKVYHNMAAHYNSYFNGNEAFKEAVKSISDGQVDDYSKVLDVIPLGTVESAASAQANLERSLAKASMVIHKHSMFFGKKEEVKWVYYSYLLMGKTRFYKREYGTAKEVFRFIRTKYSKEDVSYDAQMWIAFIDGLQGNYGAGIAKLDGIKNAVNQGLSTREAFRMLPQIYADLYVRQANYQSAIPHLQTAISRSNKKSEKARLAFILGQCLQNVNNKPAAIEAYKIVLKRSPDYKMDFNARMNMAACYEKGDPREVVKQLQKMLRDPKNVEFQDQIYYALAEIELKSKHKQQAIEYLKLSVQKSTVNNKQKALSSLKLADLYFDDQKYMPAQAYYDSTMLFLPKDYPDYAKLEKRKNNLKELVKYLLVVQREDSLQKIAALSPNERNALIDKQIQDLIAQEQKKADEERQRLENLAFMEDNKRGETQLESVTQKTNVSWYFYNQSSVSNGLNEFKTKWGNRKLTDFWRLNDKEVQSFDDISDQKDEGEYEDSLSTKKKENLSSKSKNTGNSKSREFYLKDLPLSAADMDSSNARIEYALYSIGVIYYEKLQNNSKAIESFGELERRFPKSPNNAHALYIQYRIFEADGNKSDARFYSKRVIEEYPNSVYAKLLQDPNYLETLKKEADRVKVFYTETYDLYGKGKYQQVIANNEIAKMKFAGNDEYLARFEMLKAMSIGTQGDTLKFIKALEEVENTYPKSEVKSLATQMIANLKAAQKPVAVAQKEDQKAEDKTRKKGSFFSYEPDEVHMYLVMVDLKNLKASDVKNSLSNHNQKYFASENLTISAIPINENLMMIGVSNFPNAAKAIEYLNTTVRSREINEMLELTNNDYFVISEGNYTRLFKSKEVEGYRQFYNENYRKK